MSNQSAGITSRSMLFLSGKDAGVKRSFLEIEGDTVLGQIRVWPKKEKAVEHYLFNGFQWMAGSI
jgi:hypothetical protein